MIPVDIMEWVMRRPAGVTGDSETGVKNAKEWLILNLKTIYLSSIRKQSSYIELYLGS